MTPRQCFMRKMAAGRIPDRAGREILDALDEGRTVRGTLGVLEREGAGTDAIAVAKQVAAEMRAEAARKADLARRSAIKQANTLRAFKAYTDVIEGLPAKNRPITLRGLRPVRLGDSASTLFPAVRSMLMRDPHEIATWSNADMLSRQIRGEAHGRFAEAIDRLRPKALGLKAETANELEVLRALYGEPAAKTAVADARAFADVAEWLRQLHEAEGGKIPHRQNWRLPNPPLDRNKVTALGPERFKEAVRGRLDRGDMIDYRTGKPLSDQRLEQLLDETYDGYRNGFAEGPPSARPSGRRMLANERDVARFFVWKDAESWQWVAENLATHSSPYDTMIGHIEAMADEIGLMRVTGPNPEAWRRFVASMFERETGRLSQTADELGKSQRKTVKANRQVASAVRHDRQRFDDAWAETTGLNNVPVHSEAARALSDARSAILGGTIGSAILSSLTDAGTVLMNARFNGIPMMRVAANAIAEMTRPGSEIFAAQQGLIADTLAQSLSSLDKAMGETVRTGRLAKIGNAVVRASGLRRWTAAWRNAFGLNMMAHGARERGKLYGALDADFRGALARYGIGESDWNTMRAVEPGEPSPKAYLLRPKDIAGSGADANANSVAAKWAQLINTEMDYAVIEHDPVARALLIGDSRPGTSWGEFRRGAGMYKLFPTAIITTLGARAFARGWDGRRLAHGALTFAAMTALGVVAMQAKQVVAGRDPRPMGPSPDGLRSFGAAILQGGGLGVFGDMLFVDKTRYGNSWASVIAGPQFAVAETVLGDFVWKNIQKAAQGEDTTFLGDALFAAGRLMPGGNLWYARLAFEREVLDQLALMVDPRTPDRFRRIEQSAARDYGQGYFWRPGERSPDRLPALIGGGR